MACALGLTACGCGAITIPMGGLLGDNSPETTGSVTKTIDTGKLPAADWKVANGAVALALARPDAGISVPWENPTTGARGTVTPLPMRDPTQALPCRTFLVSHVRDASETWHQGEACRLGANWQVQAVRPLDKTG